MHAAYVTSVWIHIVAACLWLGGMLFLVLVLVPALKHLQDPALSARLIRETGRRFRLVGWVTLGVLVGSGLSNLYARGVRIGDALRADFWNTPFGGVLGFKLAIVFLILALSAWHDFKIGPRASEAARSAPDAPETERLRALARGIGRLNLLLALVVAACGVMLTRGRPW